MKVLGNSALRYSLLQKNTIMGKSAFNGLTIIGILALTLVGGLILMLTQRTTAEDARFAYGAWQTNSNTTKKKKDKKVGSPKMENPKQTALSSGSWGGEGIRLSVAEKASTVEYSCAHGEITESIKLDSNGNFKASGFHTREMGGPIREDDPQRRQPAHYMGRVSGKNMTLKVVLTDSGTTVGDFKLELGKSVRLFRCM